MIPFRLTAKAKKDLKRIAKVTQAKWGKEQRNIYLKQFDDAFHQLANKPELGKACDFIRTGYRNYPQASHIIFYKYGTDSKIEIIRILHKRMDVSSQLR